MKRDMELVRGLLLLIESNETDQLKLPENIDLHKAAAHLKLIEQAGYINASIKYADNKPYFISAKLTWNGHEVLDSIKNDTIWNKTKEVVASKGLELGSVTFSTLKDLAIFQIKKTMGLE